MTTPREVELLGRWVDVMKGERPHAPFVTADHASATSLGNECLLYRAPTLRHSRDVAGHTATGPAGVEPMEREAVQGAAPVEFAHTTFSGGGVVIAHHHASSLKASAAQPPASR